MSWVGSLTGRLARGLVRAAYPEFESQHKLLADALGVLQRLDERLRDQARDLKELKSVPGALRQLPTSDAVRSLSEQSARTEQRIKRHTRLIATRLRKGETRGEESRSERRVLARLERMAASRDGILVGPWAGEVGFELLYWIPFVNWFRERYDVDPARLLVLSRGGVRSWYAHIAPRYVDALSYVTTDEFRAATDLVKKQRGITSLDAALLRRVRRGERVGRLRLLHPQLMYQLFWNFWKEQVSVRVVDRYTSYESLRSRTAQAVPPGLPSSYVAVRFYFSACFPDTEANRAFVTRTIESLAAATDVVLINTPFRIDDHVDFAGALGPRVHAIADMLPERNLAIQTEVIRGARAFVGTYGGYAYLAPMLGVPSLSFFSTREFYQHHLDLAQRVVERLSAPSLVVLDVRDADLMRAMLAAPQPLGAHP